MRSRLALITLIAVAPALGLLAWQFAGARAALLAAARGDAAVAAAMAAERQTELLTNANRALRRLARTPDLLTGTLEDCRRAIGAMAEDHPQLLALGVIAPDGTDACRTPEDQPGAAAADIALLRAAAGGAGAAPVVAGGYGGGTGRRLFVVQAAPQAAPDPNLGPAPPAVLIYAIVGLPDLGPAKALLPALARAEVTLLGPSTGSGPGWHGSREGTLPPPLATAASSAGATAADGMVAGFAPVRTGDGPPWTVVVWVREADVLAAAQQRLPVQIAGGVAAALLACALAWTMADITQVRPIGRLVRDAIRLGGGDLAVPQPLAPWHAAEFRALAEALAEMARGLQTLRAEQAGSERLHRTLSENCSDMICLITPERGISYVSAAAAEILGYPLAELTHDKLIEIAAPDDRMARTQTLQRLWTGALESASLERQVRHKDGHWITLEVKYRLVRDPATGAPTDVVSVARDVTARRQAEQMVRAREAQLRLVAENATDMIVHLDADFRRLYVSPACFDLFGYTPQEMLDASDFAAQMHPDDRPEVQRNVALLRGGAPVARFEYRRQHRDGHYLWVSSAARRLAGGEGYVMVIHDITGLKQIEADLRAQRSFFRALFAQSQDGLMVMQVTPDGGFVLEEINRVAAQALGIAPEAAIGCAPVALMPGEAGEILERNLQRCLSQRAVLRADAWLNSRHQDVDVMHVPIIGDDGRIDRILVNGRDVTHIKAAERAAAQANRWLLMAEQMAGLGHWRILFPTREVTWSAGVYAIYGIDPAAPQPDMAEGLTYVHPEDRDAVMREIETLVASGTPCRFPCRLVRPDGSLRHVQARVVPEFDRDGAVASVFGVIMDITEQMDMLAALQEARDAAQAAQQVLAELALEDALTGLANRRQLDGTLAERLRRAVRDATPLALALIDVDRFKQYNDRYGHVAGDDCLRALAVAVRSCLKRPLDLAARYGGEEFAVLLPDTDLAGAWAVAEDIRRSIRSLRLPHEGSEHGVVTISVGVAAVLPTQREEVSAAMLVGMADAALYEAKSEGRDVVRAHRPAATAVEA